MAPSAQKSPESPSAAGATPPKPTAEKPPQNRREPSPASDKKSPAAAPAAAGLPLGSPKVRSAFQAARVCPAERAHMEHVARLSALLFDATQDLHRLGANERDLLICAALMHDIGFAVAEKGHHKYSMHVILKAEIPPLTTGERLIVANVARYHRKALPKLGHPRFAQLRPAERKVVRALAALLRVADGLDRAHENAVASLTLRLPSADTAELLLTGPGHLDEAAAGAVRKADLFEKTFGRRLRIRPEGEEL